MTRILLFSVAVLCVVLGCWQESTGCAPAPKNGESVDIRQEEAIILYDAKSKVEHFIRRANFQTAAQDFGFLVPTPTRPELGEAKSEIFQTLHYATAPRVVDSGYVRRIVRQPYDKSPKSEMKKAEMKMPEVLEKKTVAGLDATVLRAEDIAGLRKWLLDHQYDARAALMDWLKQYVDARWIIIAFKISRNPQASSPWQTSVRMSFQTDTPFYPYREPADMRGRKSPEGRTLRVFFLGDARYAGSLGKEDGRWPAEPKWANTCAEATGRHVIDNLGLADKEAESLKSQSWYLTEFEDRSSPRPGTNEVYFQRSADQSSVERPVIYRDQVEFVDSLPKGAEERVKILPMPEKDSDRKKAGEANNPAVVEAPKSPMWWIVGGSSIALVVLVVVAIVVLRLNG